MTMKFEDVPQEFYSEVLTICILFSAGTFFTTFKIRQMLRLYYEKKELFETIKLLLQAFPESVIIESEDPNIENEER
jgi:hypothetical protein